MPVLVVVDDLRLDDLPVAAVAGRGAGAESGGGVGGGGILLLEVLLLLLLLRRRVELDVVGDRRWGSNYY